MLKNPYVSRVFGHLIDLVRTVKPSASFRISSTVKIFTISTLRTKIADTKARTTVIMPKTILPSRQAAPPPFTQGRLQSNIRHKNIAILVAKDSFRLPCVERKAQAPRKCKHLLCCRRKVNEGLFCLCKLLFNKPFVYSLKSRYGVSVSAFVSF